MWWSSSASRSRIWSDGAIGPRQRDEAGNRDVLGAGSWRDFRRRQQRGGIDTQGFETLAQHLATLTECRLGDPLQGTPIAWQWLFAWHEPDQG